MSTLVDLESSAEARPAEPAPGDAAPAVARAIDVRGAAVRFGTGVEALRGIDLDVPRGARVAILGASGSGKTTLLAALAGRVNLAAGNARAAGRVASIHQDLRLVGQRSALSNVLHGALGRHGLWRSLVGFPAPERQRAIALLRRVGLGHRIDHRVSRLSGGEQQRVAIARALMQDPDILLADEPVAALDQVNAQAIMRLLDELVRERGLTLLCVLHDCALAETFADRIIGLDDGRIVYDHAADHHDDPGASAHPRWAGVRRFDPCRACATLARTPPTPPADAPADRPAPRRLRWAGLAAGLLGLYAFAFAGLGITPRDTENALGNIASFIARLIPSGPQRAAIDWPALGRSLLATLHMSLIATTLAIAVAWPLAALAARNVAPPWLGGGVRFVLNVVRSIPSLVWALLFVGAVGLGPFAGVLALVAYSLGYLSKFFYEAFEAVAPGPADALAEIGAGPVQRFVHAVCPASGAAVLSSCLFMLEYNVRAASVLGVVGAGGIGHELKLAVDWGNWHVVGAIVLILAAVVLLLDALSARLRARLARA